MDCLPQEIYDSIGDLFDDRLGTHGKLVPFTELPFDRPALATTSRKWQHAIERQSFRTISLKSTDLDRFCKIVVGRRRSFLQTIQYHIILPAYSRAAYGRFEAEPDRQANNRAFTMALHGLFQILKSWDSEGSSCSMYSVFLDLHDVYSPSDPDHRILSSDPRAPNQHQQLLPLPVPLGGEGQGQACDLQHHRFRYSYLCLHPSDKLPVVPAIAYFTMYPDSYRRRLLAPHTAVQIAARLPNLRAALMVLSDCETRYPALRYSNRDAVVSALRSLSLPATLRTLKLVLTHFPPRNQTWHPANLCLAGVPGDLLSTTIREATASQKRLARLIIDGTVDASLLWPGPLEEGLTPAPVPAIVEPFWQALEYLTVTFDLTTPSGHWYFQGRDEAGALGLAGVPTAPSGSRMPPGYGGSEEESVAAALQFSDTDDRRWSGQYPPKSFRVIADKARLSPLIEAFGRACLQMPVLRRATLKTRVYECVRVEARQRDASGWWGIYYAAPGEDLMAEHLAPRGTAQRRLILDIRDWRLDESLYELLQGIGQEIYTDELDTEYVDLWGTVQRPQLVKQLQEEGA